MFPVVDVGPRLPQRHENFTILSKSYRLGLQIVVGTIVVSGIICAIGLLRAPHPVPRAAQDLGRSTWPVGDFAFTERSGRPITSADLKNRVWIAGFIFTRCPLSCPRISSVMKELQEKLRKTDVLLVSVTVDPEHDTPEILKVYADRFGAVADRWLFLTGSKNATYDLIQRAFKLPVAETSSSERGEGIEAFSHSDRLALVDRGRIIGFFDSGDPAARDELVARSARLAQPAWIRTLPTVNASLNALCAVLLLSGWFFIRQRHFEAAGPPRSDPGGFRILVPILQRPAVQAHLASMLLAVVTSGVFLTFYLIYHYHAGSMPFQRQGGLRWLYLTILLSHTALATFGVVPLVVVTLYRAARRDYVRHLHIAQITFPIWLYVSVTGVVIYMMLYHLPADSLG